MPIQTLDYPGSKIQMHVENDIEATFRAQACAKEPWTVAAIEKMPPGSWFIDVGANVGSYTLLSVARGLSVLAFEPSVPNFYQLFRNLALNNWLDRAMLVWAAAGATNSTEWFHYADLRTGAANHVLGGGERKRTFHKQRVPIFTLDTFMGLIDAPVPILLKVDCDGGEAEVFKGATGLLADPRLSGIVCEMQPTEEKDLVAQLASAGWKLSARTDHRGGKPMGVAYGEFGRA